MLSIAMWLAAAPVSVGPDFQGLEQVFTQKTDSDLGKKRMNDCGFRETTEAPSLTFDVTAAPKDLQLELAETQAGAVLTLGTKHLCLKPGVTSIDTAGTYSLYLLDGPSHPGRLNAKVRLFSTSQRSKQFAKTVQKVRLDGSGPNPVVVKSVANAPSFDPATVSARCAKVRVSPLAELSVTQASRFELTAPDRLLFVVSPSGCTEVDEEGIDLEPGAYALWHEESSEPLEVSILDTERSMKLETTKAGAATPSAVSVAQLPTVVRAKVQKETEERDDYAACEIRGRKPAFQFDPGTSLETLHVFATGGLTKVTFDVIGDGIQECGKRSLRLSNPRKAYLFISGEKAGETVVAFTDGRGVSPFWSSSMPGASAPASERVVSYAYPFWASPDFALPSAPPLFATAPASLFVFLARETKEVPATEPLLVLAHDGKSAVALRANGEQLKVRAAALTTEVPASVTVPAVKAPPPAKTTDDAWANAGPLEQARVDAWEKRQRQYLGCVGDYMQKHDPAWGKSYELIYVRSGLNVSDVVYARARSACGEAKFKKDGEAFIKAINDSHAKLVGALEGTLKKRLGR